MPGSPMAPMFVKIQTHKTIKDKVRRKCTTETGNNTNNFCFVKNIYLTHFLQYYNGHRRSNIHSHKRKQKYFLKLFSNMHWTFEKHCYFPNYQNGTFLQILLHCVWCTDVFPELAFTRILFQESSLYTCKNFIAFSFREYNKLRLPPTTTLNISGRPISSNTKKVMPCLTYFYLY